MLYIYSMDGKLDSVKTMLAKLNPIVTVECGMFIWYCTRRQQWKWQESGRKSWQILNRKTSSCTWGISIFCEDIIVVWINRVLSQYKWFHFVHYLFLVSIRKIMQQNILAIQVHVTLYSFSMWRFPLRQDCHKHGKHQSNNTIAIWRSKIHPSLKKNLHADLETRL